MTTLSDRPNTALIVIDVQNGVVADTHRPAWRPGWAEFRCAETLGG